MISRVLESFCVMLSCCLEFPSSWISLSFGKSWSSWFILCFVEFWCVEYQSSWVMLCCTMRNFVEHLFWIWCCWFFKIEWIWEHLSWFWKMSSFVSITLLLGFWSWAKWNPNSWTPLRIVIHTSSLKNLLCACVCRKGFP